MRSTKLLSMLFVVLILTTGNVWGGESDVPAGTQTNCPVMGGKIDLNHYVDHEGKRVYFCCGGCVETFNNDPGKYIEQMEKEAVTLARIPHTEGKPGHGHHHEAMHDHGGHLTKCPAMSKDLKTEFYTDYKGERLYFCCEECKMEFEKDPQACLEKHKSGDCCKGKHAHKCSHGKGHGHRHGSESSE